MDAGQPTPGKRRFDRYEVDLTTGQLLRDGTPVPLQEQPFRILAALLERPGELVTRQQLRDRLWPDGVFVDFEHGLDKAVTKLRRALGDSPESPRFVETLSRRGYRFLVSVQGPSDSTGGASPRLIWESRTIPLAEGEHVIGREEGSTLWIDSSTVSRRHARILVSTGTAMLEDLGSKNGTFLRGARIESVVPLRDGDEIRVGEALVVFRASSGAASTKTAAGPEPTRRRPAGSR
jgi:DNA-binding winged helix-turn-helix (wHTH) protein